MRILVTNHHLNEFAGSETFTFTLATTLQSRGHQVAVLTAETGAVSSKLNEAGIPVTTDPAVVAENEFDIIHAHHSPMAVLARHFLPETPMIFVSHGIAPGLEEPPSIDVKLAATVAVSEEVQANLAANHGINTAQIVRNGVDTNRFAPRKPISESLSSVLVISNRISRELLNPLQQVAEERGAKLRHIGLHSESIWETEKAINDADLVISLGRGVLEAMACGRAVLVYDVHGGDGLVTESSYEEIRKRNFSGRTGRQRYGTEDFRAFFDAYTPKLGEVNRELALQHHNADDMATAYEQVYQSAMQAEVKSRPAGYGGRELLFYQQFYRQTKELMRVNQTLTAQNRNLQIQIKEMGEKVSLLMEKYKQEKARMEEEKKRLGIQE